mmetsp:Transcript_11011/g.34993  ORF Transcript_11011/g.34993 Transcript_11011/m.34993 type:complete len:279 (-) Transcript_11011:966-1802(-)
MDARTSVLDGRSVRRRRSSLRLLITRLASSEIESYEIATAVQNGLRRNSYVTRRLHAIRHPAEDVLLLLLARQACVQRLLTDCSREDLPPPRRCGAPHSRAAHKRRCLPKQQVQTRHEAPHLAARPSATSERPPHACNATTSSAPSAACHSRSEATAPPSRLEGSAAASLVTGGAALAAGGAASNDAASATRKHVLVRPAARARWEAYATASALASMPSTRNCGIAAASSSVKSPLPQPRSMTSGSASEEGTAAVCLPSSSARAWCSIHRSCGSFFSR